MTAPLIPQEIYLLERYSSLDYFGHMRDHFAATVKAAQDALDEFMKCVPPDYRGWHPSQQPDQVWGERIIPNLQWTLDGLNKAYIRIAHGDLDALGLACNVGGAFAAINRDYSWEWMPKSHFDVADEANSVAWNDASNISITSRGDWLAGALTTRYKESNRGPLNAPASWPMYRLNPQVRVKTGEKVPRNGIYLPDLDSGCAQLLIEGYEAWQTAIPDPPADPRITSAARKHFDTTWTLVERVADTGGDTGIHVGGASMNSRLRCEAGQPCPAEGEWFTPGIQGFRHFKQGEIMPDMKTDYGQTIWYCEQQTT
jgi:hypothetical protein